MKSAVIGDDLDLLSDLAIMSFGADKDVSLTHVADTGLLLNSTMAIQFNDSTQYIKASSAADLDLAATTDINMDCTTVDINGALDVSGVSTLTGDATFGGDIVADANEAKAIFAAVTSNNVTVGGAGSTTVLDTCTVGGGFGSSGVTLSAGGAISANGLIKAGGGYGSSGTTLGAAGEISADGAMTINGNATFNGTTTLGNATGDDVTVNGYLASALTPKTDSTYDLGTSALRWSTIYVDSIVGADVAWDVESIAPGSTIDAATDFALVTAGNGGTVTLPSATAGKVVRVKLSASVGDLIVSANTNDTIESSGSIRLESTGSAVILVALDTTNWFII